jgi:hypothetical protein
MGISHVKNFHKTPRLKAITIKYGLPFKKARNFRVSYYSIFGFIGTKPPRQT